MVLSSDEIQTINPNLEAFFVINNKDQIIYKNNNFGSFFKSDKKIETKANLLDFAKKKYTDDLKKVLDGKIECLVFNTKYNKDNSIIIRKILIENENSFFFMKKTLKKENDNIKGVILDSITKNSYDIVTFLDIHGNRLYVSPSVSKIFNISKKELLERNIFLDVHPNDISLAKKLFLEVTKKPGEIITNVRIRLKHNRDDWVLMEGSIVNLLDLDGINALVVNSRSIQEVKKLQDNLFENEYKLDGIIKNSHASIYIKDVEGHYLMINKSYQKILKLKKEEVLGKTDFEIFSKEQASKIYVNDEEIKSKNTSINFEEEIEFPDGSIRCFITNKFALLNADKEIIGFCAISNEITKRKQAIAKLEQSESWFRAIVQNSLDYVTVINPKGEKKYITPSVKRVLGFTPNEYLKINFFENIPPEFLIQLISTVREVTELKPNKNISLEIKVPNKNGDWIWVEMIFNNQIDNKYINGILVHVRDINESKNIKKELDFVTNKHQLMINNSPDLITIKDLSGKFLDINKTFQKLVAKSKKDILNKTILDIIPKKLGQKITENDIKLLFSKKKSLTFEEIYEVNSEQKYFLSTKFLLFDKKNKPQAICNISTDITSRKKMMEKLETFAYYDGLTNLYNRRSMIDKINKALENNTNFAILFIDLDRFKIINDSLGHSVGDKVILEFSKRLQKISKKNDIIGRFSGDEFLIFIPEIKNIDEIKNYAKKIHDENLKPITIEKNEIFVTSSIGITIKNDSNQTAQEYIRDGDNALYQAKNKGRGNYAIFNSQMHEKVIHQMKMESEIIKAVDKDEFEIHYQPIYNFESNKLSHFEALVRWNHPRFGIIKPDKFLDFVFEMGYISKLDRLVIEKVMKQVSQWKKINDKVQVNINISAVQFGYGDLYKYILDLIKKNNLSPSNIKFEITESEVLENLDNAIAIISKLKKKGVHFVLDDFGTGYSSLSYLRQIPVDMIKIDRSFITNMVDDGTTMDIVKAIVNLSHSLGFKIVAEGVENTKQENILQNMSIDYVQGFKYGKPMDKEYTEKIIKKL